MLFFNQDYTGVKTQNVHFDVFFIIKPKPGFNFAKKKIKIDRTFLCIVYLLLLEEGSIFFKSNFSSKLLFH